MRVLVVADDVTGANATGGRFARRGFATVTATAEPSGSAGRSFGRFDVVVASTGSRYADPGDAARRVGGVVARWPADLVVKRIDTTLRGNLGAEIDAAMHAVAGTDGPPVRALVVPAYPAAGRTTVGGIQLVDGVELTATEAARDPHRPLRSSRVADLIAGQSDRPIGEVALDAVLGGDLPGVLAALRDDAEILVCDALVDRHLRLIAAAAAEVTAAGDVRWLAVDPGPFGAELAAALDPRGTDPVLVVAGSVTAVTGAQLDALEQRLQGRLVEADVTRLDVADLARRVAASEGEIVGLRTDRPVADLDVSSAGEVTAVLGAVTRRVLEERRVAGCYVTGGDVTAGVLVALDADGLEIEDEVEPLAVAGRVVGGPHTGLPVVTKGGLIGGEDTAVACVERLRRVGRRRRAATAENGHEGGPDETSARTHAR